MLSFSLPVKSAPKPQQKLASAKGVKEALGQNHEIVSKVSRPEKSLLGHSEVVDLGVRIALYMGVGGKESVCPGQESD